MWEAVPAQPLYLSASEALPPATRTRGARLARLPGSSAKPGEVAESVLPSRKRQLDRHLAARLAPWLAPLLAGAGPCYSLPVSPGGMLAATAAAALAQQPLLAFRETSAPEVLTATFSPSNTSSITLKTSPALKTSLLCRALHPLLSVFFSLRSRGLCNGVPLYYEFLQYFVGWNSALISAIKTHQAKGKRRLWNGSCLRRRIPCTNSGPRARSPLDPCQSTPAVITEKIKCFYSTPSHHHNCQLRPHHRIFISGDNSKE